MNEITCKMIADILPLYAENMVSDDTRALVETHLAGCEHCRAMLEGMQRRPALPRDDGSMLRRLHRRLWMQKAKLAIFCGLMVLLLMSLYSAHLYAPIALPAEEAILSVTPVEDGKYFELLFSPRVYNSEYHVNPDGTIFITCWDTAYNQKNNYWGGRRIERIPSTQLYYSGYSETAPLETDTPQTARVNQYIYYYSAANKGHDDVLLYKTPGAPEPNYAGVQTLPRLTLNYYFLIAIALTSVCAALTIALRVARRKYARMMLHITIAPACYVACSFAILNGRGDIYNIEYYLSAILLTSIVLCLLIRLVMYMFRREA